jgi:hypothetical protein
MKFISILFLMAGLQAFADTSSEEARFSPQMEDVPAASALNHPYGCRVANPYEHDAIGRYCPNGYGVMWDGYILDDSCYAGIDTAFQVMDRARVCHEPTVLAACEIIQPNTRDRGQRYCNKMYGVSYYGFIVDNVCFQNADSALDKMRSVASCTRTPQYGRCQILQHGQRDRNQRYCDNSYGVAYDGVIMNNTCFFSLDTAMNQMFNSMACRY